MAGPTSSELLSRFTYHTPKEDQIVAYTLIRGRGLDFAQILCANCPDSRERSVALTKLDEVVMWANASIARNS